MEKADPGSFNTQPVKDNAASKPAGGYTSLNAPQIALPKSGGAIKSIDEKFSVNGANGTAGLSIPFPFSPSRNGFMPGVALAYNSGSGNGIFGLGWNAEPAAIVRKTDNKLPEYNDALESDIFIFSGAEDLIPLYKKETGGNWVKDSSVAGGVTITRYRPRIESGFARIEKITEAGGNVYWKVTTGDNVVSVLGKSKTAQVYHPADPTKIFKWLLEFSYDDKGNCFQFEYKQEDKINVPFLLHEKNRLNDFSTCSNAYLKRIKYCNKNHFNRSSVDFTNWNNFLNTIEYLLEMVLDYGEHNSTNPQPNDQGNWICRTDPFSVYRAGFEIRTYRFCKRVLMFHRFAELGTQPCLVRSMNMEYTTGTDFTFLTSVTQKGFIRKADNTYSEKALPPLEFLYKPLGWNTEIKSLPKESLDNLPTGIDDGNYSWVDLYNEGIAGVLTEQANSWYYKSNAGNGYLDGIKPVAQKPSLSGLSSGSVHFQDIEGDGQKFLVSNDLDGFYELNDDNEWLPFKNFTVTPNIDLHDSNLKLIDLNGDGKADILISEDDVFTWYASKGKDGFEAHQHLQKRFDEEKGPNIVFADNTQSIVLADMSGDGLMDIVRIRYSDIVYWPNLGYGKFGAKVNMSNAPVFDTAEDFKPHYVKLADLDGSGVTDVIYLGNDSFKIYFNQGGNSWSKENIINGINPLPFPKIDEHTNVTIIDLLGTGTGCIVWSSPLPQYAGNALRYIDLMNGEKPHVMASSKNNMGKETFVQYKSSTAFYLADKKAGTPWITKLPFPVQCVSEVVVIDKISKTRFASQYTYHHGYYDHHEREFRGFGRVDQTDTEDFENYKKLSNPDGSIQLVDEGFHQPPMLTKTWFHTGAFLDKEKILSQFAHEYYQNAAIPEKELADPALPVDLTIDEWREALRVCKGMPLRTEVYSRDGSDKQSHPYTTANHSCFIQLIQPTLENKYAVFQVIQSESLTYTYERNPADPRIAHSMTIAVNDLGMVLKAANISYGRKLPDASLTALEQAEQSRNHIVFSEKNVTNKIDTGTDYHLPVSFEAKDYELTGLVPDAGPYFSIIQVKNDFELAATIGYEIQPTSGKKEKRLLKHAISVFLKNDLSAPLATGVIESLALPYQSYQLSMTAQLRDFIFGNKISDELLTGKGRYVHFNDANYWIPSGTQTLDAAHFYQATAMTDPFGFKTEISYEQAYRFFVQQTTDALGNKASITGFNFRTLSPYLLQDMNDNRSAVRTDELGMVMSTFTMGKENEKQGDFLDNTSVEASANDQPTSILVYNLVNYLNSGKPNFIKTTARETHHFDSLATGKPAIWQTGYAYADGGGKILMQKAQAEPGIALKENADGTITQVDTTPNLRWIGNGRTILNNKGKPVKQYEPYFSTSFEFEDAKELVERGISPVISYDAAGRAVRTDFPNGTFTKIVFDAWTQHSFDQNDAVLESQWYKDRIVTPVATIATPEEIAAANKAATHANTAIVSYLDSLGKSFLSVANNGTAGKYKTITQADIEANLIRIKDARNNLIVEYRYDMLGARLYQHETDSGERWVMNDVTGKPLTSFDSRSNTMRYEYDNLHRPLKIFVQQGTAKEINTEKLVYGEGITNDKQLNLRGKPYRHFDTAGVVTNTAADFKNNQLQTSQQFCSDYKNTTDWNNNPALNQEVFTASSVFDALNRPVKIQLTDKSIIRPVYNEAGALNQVFAGIKGMAEKQFVKDISYDAKGQRQAIIYGNNTKTNYSYDSKTLRLSQVLTTGNNGTDLLQKLQYTYDPVGNLISVKDDAQQTLFFKNNIVNPSSAYTYDAVYRLINATGREHAGQNQPVSPHDEFRTNMPMPGDGAAMRNYSQSYLYDETGNILQMIHAAGTGSWTRIYEYETAGNRLKMDKVNTATESYSYDAHGNILSLTHLQGLTWDFRDHLQKVNLGGGGTAYYVYDAGGERVRKIIERADGSKEERVYLGKCEVYRKTNNAGSIQEETETLHVMDDTRRIAMTETKTIENGVAVAAAKWLPLQRYQYSNHLNSCCLELDDSAVIISYEEYHPYGTTAYQAMNATVKAAAKRYRYTGMERDEESGLCYHSARYYLPWLARWLSADPVGMQGGLNLYAYALCNPVSLTDAAGTSPVKTIDVGLPGYTGPSELIEVHNAAPSSLAGQAAIGLSEVKTRAQFRNQEEREYKLKPGHWTSSQIEQNYAEHPEDRVNDEIALEARYVAYYKAKEADLKKQQRRTDAAANVGTAIAHVTVTLITLPGGFMGTYVEVGALGTLKIAGKMYLGGKAAAALSSSGGSDGGFGTVLELGGSIVAGSWGGGQSKAVEEPAERLKIVQGDYEPVVNKFTDELVALTGKPVTKIGLNGLKGESEITVIAHGNRTSIEINGMSHTPEQFAKLLVDNGWEGGTIRLMSCNTGSSRLIGKSFAQRAANELSALGSESAIIAPKGWGTVVPKSLPNAGMPGVLKETIASYIRGARWKELLPNGKGWKIFTANN